MPKFYDIEIKCQCGEEFVWTAGEQRFMNQLHDEGKIDQVNKPKRCPACRAKKKQKFENQERQ